MSESLKFKNFRKVLNNKYAAVYHNASAEESFFILKE